MGTKRVGLARTQALLEQLNRALNLQYSDLTIRNVTGSIVTASFFIGDGSSLTGITATASPGGSDTQVQFNSGSSLGGSSNLTFDYSSGTNQLKVVGAISGSNTFHSVGAATFSSTIAASSSVTAGTSFIIGSADLNETDLEKLDGITDGTAAANKAVVLDGSKNIATIGTLGCGAITSTGASTYGSLSGGALSGSSTLHAVGAATFSSTIAASSSISASAFYDTTLGTAINVTGVDSAVDRSLIVANGTSGKAITGSIVTMDPAGNIDAGPTTISANKFSAGGSGVTSTGPISGSSTLHAEGAATFSSTIAATGSVTAGSSFIIGSADLNETDLEKLDGITDGTAAANKAVVLDASKNIATIGTLGCGAITSTGASTYGSLSGGALSGSGTLHVVGAATFSSTIAASSSISASSTITAGSFVGANLNRHYVNELPLSFSSVTTITLGTGSCTDSTNTVYIDHTASVDVVITDAGINGLDAGSEATSTWYAVYVVSGTSGVGGLLSTSETAPTMPSGFTYKRRVGWVYNHSDDDLQNFIQTGMGRERSYTWFETGANYTRVLHNAVSSGVRTAVDISSRIPPSAHAYIFAGFPGSASTAAEDQSQANPLAVSGSGNWFITRAQNTTIGAGITLTSQEFPVKRGDGQTVGFDYITYFDGDLTVNIKGWKETI